MKADSLQMAKVFSNGGDIHYVLPHFQREYAWEKDDWQILLNDIFSIYEVYGDGPPPEHFMGALVVINDGTQAGTVPIFRLVDGQQRLTTISLLFCAFRSLLDENGHESLSRKLQSMLVNQYEGGHLYYKILPTLKYGDRASYCAIVDQKEPPIGVESRIPSAYVYLHAQLASRFKGKDFDPDRLFVVLMNSLQVVFIDLNQRERPYEIFESLNYKGKSLTQADLVRNYIAMKLPPERQEEVFTELWSPIEEMLLEKRKVGRSGLGELTAFLRHYFGYQSGILINKDHVYSRFRDRGEAINVETFVEELEKLKRFAGYYDRLLRPEHEKDTGISRQLSRLNILESATAYPVFLFMYNLWYENVISRADFLKGLRLFEIYLVRRFLARESTNYNRLFPPLVNDIDTVNFVESLQQLLGSKGEPNNTRLRRAAEQAVLYDRSQFTRQKLALVFDTVNRYLSKDSGAFTVLDDDPTIEHVMPQTLSNGWKEHLGSNWEQEHELLHTLGNLTLVTKDWNSQLSNSIYETKRQKLRGHGLELNKVYFIEFAPDIWNGDAIRKRAQWLMSKMEALWPQLGEASTGSEEQPKRITILGEVFDVNSWRDVLRQTAEVTVTLTGKNFESQIVSEMSNVFRREPFGAAPYQLQNGWWIQSNWNAATIKSLCTTLIQAADIPDEEYELELW